MTSGAARDVGGLDDHGIARYQLAIARAIVDERPAAREWRRFGRGQVADNTLRRVQ